MIQKLRCILFNILFYGFLTPLACIVLLPLLLFPRKIVHRGARLYLDINHLLEKYVLGLDYEIRGMEYFPQGHTNYLVAAKHQSAYETLKLLHLFGDPTIILKRELLWIPLFGWFLQKLDVIPIDRSNREQAMKSLSEGARRMKGNNRPIVIFPQGTRVPVGVGTDRKPYKGGILKLYAATQMPIVPLAMNSGLYWPRNSFWKVPGKVIFEFLPPVMPGTDEKQILPHLEKIIEDASERLVAEGRAALAQDGKAARID